MLVVFDIAKPDLGARAEIMDITNLRAEDVYPGVVSIVVARTTNDNIAGSAIVFLHNPGPRK
jgi:hypothetical protein